MTFGTDQFSCGRVATLIDFWEAKWREGDDALGGVSPPHNPWVRPSAEFYQAWIEHYKNKEVAMKERDSSLSDGESSYISQDEEFWRDVDISDIDSESDVSVIDGDSDFSPADSEHEGIKADSESEGSELDYESSRVEGVDAGRETSLLVMFRQELKQHQGNSDAPTMTTCDSDYSLSLSRTDSSFLGSLVGENRYQNISTPGPNATWENQAASTFEKNAAGMKSVVDAAIDAPALIVPWQRLNDFAEDCDDDDFIGNITLDAVCCECTMLPDKVNERTLPSVDTLDATVGALSLVIPHQRTPKGFPEYAPAFSKTIEVQEEAPALVMSSPTPSQQSEREESVHSAEHSNEAVAISLPFSEVDKEPKSANVGEISADEVMPKLNPAKRWPKEDTKIPMSRHRKHGETLLEPGIPHSHSGDQWGRGARLYNGRSVDRVRNFTKCTNVGCRWQPRIKPNKSACERCWTLASTEEREEFIARGRHLRIAMSYGGCSASCTLSPHIVAPSEATRRQGARGGLEEEVEPVCLCLRCFNDLHHVGIRGLHDNAPCAALHSLDMSESTRCQ